MTSTTSACKHAEIEQARSLIDTKISKADDALEIISFKRQRNMLVPISRVPLEVLCLIFVLVKSTCGKGYDHGIWQFFNWIKLTHVCHSWREVGLQAPFLWEDIPIECPRWAEEMLVRSKETALTVTADFSTMQSKSTQALRTTLLHISRIRELNLGNVHLFELLGVIAPRLVGQELPLHTLRIVQDSGATGLFGVFIFPDGMERFGSQLSSLRRLALTRSGFNWNASVLRNLTHLRLSDLPQNLHCYNIDTFLEALQGMPALEMLDYEKFITLELKESDSALSKARRIPHFSLPHLKFLRLGIEMHPLTIILSAIRPPFGLVMDIYGYEVTSSTSAFPLILSALSARLQPSNAAHCKIQTLSLDDHGECRVRSWPIILSQRDIWTSPVLPSMSTILYWEQWNESSEINFVQSLFDFMRLDNLVTLSLPHTLPLDATTWARTFGTLPALEILDIEGDNAPGVFEALTYAISSKNSIPFPSLHSIAITALESLETSDPLEDLMIGALIERYELGVEIGELIFRDCPNLSDRRVNLLRQVVLDVEVIAEGSLKLVAHLEPECHPFYEDSIDILVDPLNFWS